MQICQKAFRICSISLEGWSLFLSSMLNTRRKNRKLPCIRRGREPRGIPLVDAQHRGRIDGLDAPPSIEQTCRNVVRFLQIHGLDTVVPTKDPGIIHQRDVDGVSHVWSQLAISEPSISGPIAAPSNHGAEKSWPADVVAGFGTVIFSVSCCKGLARHECSTKSTFLPWLVSQKTALVTSKLLMETITSSR